MKYGKLTIIKEVERDKNGRRVLCKCDCGNEKIVYLNNVKRGITKSCGCLRKRKGINSTHGLSRDENGNKTRLFRIWTGIKTRCYNQKDHTYEKYGGRGITLCDEWLDYKNFHEWAMNNGYKENLTIERKDINGNYEPSNCEWITRGEQSKNRTNSLTFTYKGETKLIKDWCKLFGVRYETAHARISRGWDIYEAISTKPIPKKEQYKQYKKRQLKGD